MLATSASDAAARRIDFFVLGAQKCATSWLFYCLREHPGISLARKKREENYFGGPVHSREGDDWFFGLYEPDDGKRRGSVSVDYLHDAGALTRILQEFPQARLIAVLREPLARAASAHSWLVRKKMLPDETAGTALTRAMDQWSLPMVDGENQQSRELLSRGMYGRQLGPIFDAGAQDRLLVVTYDYVRAAALETVRRIYALVGVDSSFRPPSLSSRPKWNAHWPLLTGIERLAPDSRVMGKLMDHANQLICRLGLARPRPSFPQAVADRARSLLAPDMALLAGQLGQLRREQICAEGDFLKAWGFRPK